MKSKTIILLLVVFLGLCFVVLFPNLQEKFIRSSSKQLNEDLPLQLFDGDTTEHIQVKQNNIESNLEKESSGWKIASNSASEEIVKNFFSALQQTDSGNIVSKSTVHDGEYLLASDSGIFLTLENPSKKETFVIGKEGPENGSFYIKKLTSNNVYLAQGPLKDAIKITPDDWRNKTIVNLTPETIYSIDVSGAKGFTLKKQESKWVLIKNNASEQVEESKISSILSKFAPLEGRGFLTEEEQHKFNNGKKESITLKDKDQKILVQLEFMDEEGDQWMKKKDSNDILKVSGYKLQDFFTLSP